MKTTDKVRIRMYRQGLGDCFLITFYSKDESIFNMLVDCGVLSTSADYSKKMQAIAKNIAQETNNDIDILVATHEHWDHISGFVQARSDFESLNTKEIWMAWTENPNDAFAKSIKDTNKMRLDSILKAYSQMNGMKKEFAANMNADQRVGLDMYLNSYNSFFNFFGIDAKQGSNALGIGKTEDAIGYLKKKKGKHVFHTPHTNSVLTRAELPGVRFYILGPPKDIKALKKMDPSAKNSEVYEMINNLSAGISFCTAMGEAPDPNKPFSDADCCTISNENDFTKSYIDKDNEWRKIDNDWLLSAGVMAFTLDDVINNTSLVFAIEFIESGKILLFAADAQVGNWLSWKNYSWTVDNGREKVKVTIDDLLARTVFYKVGHHGSHNATLREEGLEKMTSNDLIAMLPVDKAMANKRGWHKMPFVPLLDTLEEKTDKRVIIMDESYPGAVNKSNRDTEGINALYFDVIINK
jgi:hypothetical protein